MNPHLKQIQSKEVLSQKKIKMAFLFFFKGILYKETKNSQKSIKSRIIKEKIFLIFFASFPTTSFISIVFSMTF